MRQLPRRRGAILMAELGQLRAFLALAEERHFTSAAARLGISQSALSQQIRRFEQQLGVRVATRTSRGLELTAAGEVLATGEPALRTIDALLDAARVAGSGEAQELVVGRLPSIHPALCADAIRRAAQADAPIRVSMRELSALEQQVGVRSGELAVGLVRDGTGATDLWFKELANEPMLVAVPHDHHLAGAGRVRFGELSGESFIVLGRGGASAARAELVAVCRQHGYEPDIQHEASAAVALPLVEAGLGIVVAPASAFSVPADSLVLLGTDLPPRRLYSVSDPGRQREVTSAFVDAFTRVLLDAHAALPAAATRDGEGTDPAVA